MSGCEVLWDEAGVQRVSELLMMATGKPCPCRNGGRCAFLPKSLSVVYGLRGTVAAV